MHKINKHAIKNILCDYVVKTKQKKKDEVQANS